jgi:hypothetical protein
MTVALSERASGFDIYHCIASVSSIVNYCDVPVDGSSPMNWKHGGRGVQGEYTYQVDISRQNRPWPPSAKPMQSCEGWYKFILHHYDIYGAGWANYDWGQKSLLPAINPCCVAGYVKVGKAQDNYPHYNTERPPSNFTCDALHPPGRWCRCTGRQYSASHF